MILMRFIAAFCFMLSEPTLIIGESTASTNIPFDGAELEKNALKTWFERPYHQQHPRAMSGMIRSYGNARHKLHNIEIVSPTLLTACNTVHQEIVNLIRQSDAMVKIKNIFNNRLRTIITELNDQHAHNLPLLRATLFFETYFQELLDCSIFRCVAHPIPFNENRIASLKAALQEALDIIPSNKRQKCTAQIEALSQAYMEFSREYYHSFIESYLNFMMAYEPYKNIHTEQLPYYLKIAKL